MLQRHLFLASLFLGGIAIFAAVGAFNWLIDPHSYFGSNSTHLYVDNDRYPRLKAVFNSQGGSLADYYATLHEDGSDTWINTVTSIEAIAILCRERDIPLVAVLLPDLHDIQPGNALEPVYEKVRTTFRTMGIKVIDLIPITQRTTVGSPQKYWIHPGDPHPNGFLHKAFGEEIAKHLAEIL
jgi:hypothetical protein